MKSYWVALCLLILACAPATRGDDFRRGDADADGIVDGIVDSNYLLYALFVPGAPVPPCRDSADVNDDGSFDISDVIYLLSWNFIVGSSEVPAPGAYACGSDPTSDALSCDAYATCAPYAAPPANPDFQLSATALTGDVGDVVTSTVTLDIFASEDVAGLSWGLCHSSVYLNAVDATSGAALDALHGGSGPDFLELEPTADGVVMASLFSFLGGEGLAPGTDREIATIDYELINPGSPTLEFCDTLGVNGRAYLLSIAPVSLDRIVPFTNSALVSIGGGGVPINNDCAQAIAITDGGHPFSLDFTDTDGSDIGASCGFGTGGDDIVHHDIWYTYIAKCDGDLTVSTAGSGLDTRLAIYTDTGCPANPATVIACDDDAAGLPPGESEITIAVSLGDALRIQLGTYAEATPTGAGLLTVLCQSTEPPINDDCSDALPISSTAEFTLDYAVTDGPDLTGECGFGTGGDEHVHHDVWYTYTATCNGNLTISTAGSGLDTRLAVYSDTGCPADASTVLGCDDDALGFPPGESAITIPVAMGDALRIQVGTYSEATPTGTGTLSVICESTDPPNNDDCAGAIGIQSSTTFSLDNATTDGPDLAGACGFGTGGDDVVHQDVWFCYTAPLDGSAAFTVGGDGIDTRIAVYDGCSCPAAAVSVLACDDDGGTAPGGSSVVIDVIEGQSYLIEVGTAGESGDTGTGDLDVLLIPTSGVLFVRGDTNASGSIDIADAISALSALFSFGAQPSCTDAADTNDDGAFDIADPVTLLSYLFFIGSPVIAEPFPACGADATFDALTCDSFAPCLP